ncbi:hypothetical protein OHC33_008792 [Knufia fluminis]|uniref:GST N-terminal domain-containing protein n=1 Tax=Knufia fluminis TaxID=191047 RepID=A0AAN8IJD9_9EURO|nr:hypothetical protein OHC33_008792 [Knufia fluminis]
MGDATDDSQGKLTLYTNYGCPWAHRAHITLRELDLSYDETIIDLEKPREEWYLKINDRGLVPTIQHSHPSLPSSGPVTVIESALVVQYLIDAFPHLSGHVLPAAKDAKSAYDRYTINLLTDIWFNKVNSFWFKALLMAGTDEAISKADELFNAMKTQFEPKLADALGKTGSGPFIGGAERMTLFEILVAPFVLRIHDFSNSEDQVHPSSLAANLNSLPAYGQWSKAVVAQESVTYIWNKEKMIESMVRRLPEMRKKYGAAK